MHPGIKHLLELQSVDIRLGELRAIVESFPKRLKEIEARLAGARQQLAAAKEAHINSLKQRKTYEMDVEQWKERARKYRDQSAAVKTNEAFKALQHEITNAEAETQAERKRLEAEQAAAQKQLEEVAAERERIVTPIDEDLLYHYHRIAKRHNGVALAEVRNETCLLCGMRVRPHVYQELRRESSDELFHCETCTRILYVAETKAAPAGAAADASAIPATAPPQEG